LRADFLAAWELHALGAQIAGLVDGGAHTRYERPPAFVGKDRRHDEVAYRAKGPADHVVEARLLPCPLPPVHATVRPLVGGVHALEGVLMELRLGARCEAGWNVDNHNWHDVSSFSLSSQG